MVKKSANMRHAHRGLAAEGDDEVLTDPMIWPFAACDDEDLAS